MSKEKSSKEDLRRPDKIVPFHIPKHLESSDNLAESFQTTATLLAMVSLFLKNRWAGWASLFFSIAAIVNDKAITATADKRASWTTFLFSLLSLIAQYIPRMVAAAQAKQSI